MAGAATKLDLRGLKCPLPVLKTKKAMRQLSSGELMEIETTDPLAVIDIPAFCNENGHRLVDSGEFEWGHTFLLEKGAA
ncbi:MAG: sulfurtransferase TusA family protein [Pseudomonadota bacterium]